MDLAPTLLRLMGMKVPASMTGRVIEEGLRAGTGAAPTRVEHVKESVRSADGAYVLTAHLSKAAGQTYLDFTDVKRP